MRSVKTLAFSLSTIVSTITPASAQNPGSLDLSFGLNGVLTNSVGGEWDGAKDMVIQDDRCILLAGGYRNLSTGNDDLAIVRYLPDGSIDSSYGQKGFVRFPLSATTNDGVSRVSLQPDGKLVFFGEMVDATGNFQWIIGRLEKDGTFDSSFGVNGFRVLDPGGSAFAGDLAILPGGKFLLAGSVQATTSTSRDAALAHLNPDGTFDYSFGNNGVAIDKLSPRGGHFMKLLVQPDGKVLCGGVSSPVLAGQFTIVRYELNGLRDSSYGVNGIATLAVSSNGSVISDMAFQSDGKLVALGGVQNSSIDWALARFDTSGKLDGSFGSAGFFLSGSLKGEDNPSRIIVLEDDRFLVSGNTATGQHDPWYYSVKLFGPNGIQDMKFGSGGVASVLPLSGGTPSGLALQKDGNIVLSGSVFNPVGNEKQDFALVQFIGVPPPVVPNAVFAPHGSGHSWTLYPNPALDVLSVRNEKGNVSGSYELVNICGQSLQKGTLNAHAETRINTQTLPKGCYLLRLQTKAELDVLQFIKE